MNINGVEIREDQLEHLIFRYLWKSSSLSTLGVCEEAAQLATKLVASFDPVDYPDPAWLAQPQIRVEEQHEPD